MKNWLLVVLGVILLVLGAVWTFQGLGYLAGSAMTGVRMWAVVGPLVAIVGLALGVAGVRGLRAR